MSSSADQSMDEEVKKMDTLTLYKHLAEVPTYSAGTVLKDWYNSGSEMRALNLHLTSRSHLLISRLKHTQTIPISDKIPSHLFPITELPTKTIEFFSPGGKFRGLLKVVGEKRIVEVWEMARSLKIAEKDVTEDCGWFLDDETWGSPSFALGSSCLLFSAHRLPPKDKNAEHISPFQTNAFTPTWGELNRSLIHPTIFLFFFGDYIDQRSFDGVHAFSGSPVLRPLISPSLDATVSFGQGHFFTSGGVEGVVATGYETMEDGRRLGIVYCTNRRSGIWRINFNEEELRKGQGVGEEGLQRLSEKERSARSPRVLTFPPGGRDALIVYLSNELGGAHGGCATLHRQTLAPSFDCSSPIKDTVLLEPVWEPASPPSNEATEPTTWPGLYLSQLPQLPFIRCLAKSSSNLPNSSQASSLTPHLVFHSINRSCSNIYTLCLDATVPQLPRLQAESDPLPVNIVLGTDGDRLMIASHGNISRFYLTACEYDPDQSGDDLMYIGPELGILQEGELEELLRHIDARVVPSLINPLTASAIFISSNQLPPSLKAYARPSRSKTFLNFEPQLPTPLSPPPLILSPHGGPHSTTLQTFSPANLALAVEGYTLALVNYTGSLGFGQRAIEELRGKCGDLDVRECEEVIDRWVDAWEKLGWKGGWEGKIFVMGGSHGGFLAAHLQTRCRLITAAILRNPVISLGENLTITDIPDWVFAELDLPYSLSSSQERPTITPTTGQYSFLQSRSPISKVDQVTSHTLLLLGTEDRRVPPSQTKAWYHSLKGRSDWIKKNNAAGKGERKKEFDVECLAFEGEGHALDGVEAEVKGFEATLEFFGRFARF